MKFCFWLLLLGLFGSGLLSAQPFTARNLSLPQGLPEYYVSGLIQDKAGFIWVATRDGLARYDGRQFTVFRHRPTGRPSLASNVILSLQSVSDSTQLIQLENRHFPRFNPITEQFGDVLTDGQLQQQQVQLANAVLTLDEKRVWGRYETQLTDYDRQMGRFTTYPFPQRPDPGKLYPGNVLLLDAPRNRFTLNLKDYTFSKLWDGLY